MQGIMFKEHLYNKIITDKKTQTRRTDGLQKINDTPAAWIGPKYMNEISTKGSPLVACFQNTVTNEIISCKPRYKKNEIIYLKENYCIDQDSTEGDLTGHIYQFSIPEENRKNYKWKSKLLMPACSSREHIIVSDWKVERLKDISNEDAILEGIDTEEFEHITKYTDYRNELAVTETPKESFLSLWESINGKESVDENQWVFAYTFEHVKIYINEIQSI